MGMFYCQTSREVRMNPELKRLIIEAAMTEARANFGPHVYCGVIDDRVTADLLPDGLSWYVEVLIDGNARLESHGYEVQLTNDGNLRAYGIGPGLTYFWHLRPEYSEQWRHLVDGLSRQSQPGMPGQK